MKMATKNFETVNYVIKIGSLNGIYTISSCLESNLDKLINFAFLIILFLIKIQTTKKQ